MTLKVGFSFLKSMIQIVLFWLKRDSKFGTLSNYAAKTPPRAKLTLGSIIIKFKKNIRTRLLKLNRECALSTKVKQRTLTISVCSRILSICIQHLLITFWDERDRRVVELSWTLTELANHSIITRPIRKLRNWLMLWKQGITEFYDQIQLNKSITL